MIKRNGDSAFGRPTAASVRSGAVVTSASPGHGATHGTHTRIPLRQTHAQAHSVHRMTPPHTPEPGAAPASGNLALYVERWKNRYEDAERRHKASVVKTEKVKRDYDELQRKHGALQDECNHLERELTERERELSKLRIVSEKVCREYQQLRNQHEIDTGLMQKVMAQAGEWYQQNKQLRRRSTALALALPPQQLPLDIDSTDANDAASETSSNEELEFLKQTVSELSRQIAELQTELSAAKLQEFEATENSVNLAQELEAEREARVRLEREAGELRAQVERHDRVSRVLIGEVGALKREADNDRDRAETFKSEARSAKKRATILAHQSALLMGELELDERLMMLLQEVDSLKDALENQSLRHEDEVHELQVKLAEKLEDGDTILWEEKIKLSEEEARKATERAEMAERKLNELRSVKTQFPPKRSALLSRISYFEGGTTEQKANGRETERVVVERTAEQADSVEESAVEVENGDPIEEPKVTEPKPAAPAPPPPPPPALPPPPPPPPPPPAVFVGAGADSGSAIADMANLLGLKPGTIRRDNKQNGGAIDAIVDQIKGGKFQLKATERKFLERPPEPAQPEAVKEMLSILGTLRKRRSRPSFVGDAPMHA